MEIKTLEHFAVVKLQEQEAEIERLKKELEVITLERDAVTKNMHTLVTTIKDRCEVRESSGTDRYISFVSCYEKWDNERFNYFVGVLGLTTDKKEEDTDNE